MNRLQFLQTKKLFKELDYIESDFEYRNEIISEADSKFISKVNDFLEEHPELKELYENKVNDRINQFIKSESCEEQQEDNFDEQKKLRDDKSPKVKKLYREIVKITHPDKSDKKSHNDIYVKATEYYDMNDKIGIYQISLQLGLDYQIDYNDEIEIKNKIDNLNNRISFLKNTLSYKWYTSTDINIRNKLLLLFIENRISN